MRNEPNFSKSQMFITLITTTNYNKKWQKDTWSKRTQTKPIYSELVEPIFPPLQSLKFSHINKFERRKVRQVNSCWNQPNRFFEQAEVSAKAAGNVKALITVFKCITFIRRN
jgi:hypothetical protein